LISTLAVLRGLAGGVGCAGHVGRNGGTFHQQVELSGQGVGIGGTGVGRQVRQVLAYLALVFRRCLMDRIVGGTELAGGVDERTAAEVVGFEPLLQHIEHCQQPLLRRPGLIFHRRFQPLAEALVPALQRGDDELVLRTEVVVQGHLGDSGLGQDAVDAGGVVPALLE